MWSGGSEIHHGRMEGKMTNRELFVAISNMIDEKLENKLESKLESKLGSIKRDIAEIKADIAELKERVSALEKRVSGLEERMAALEEDVSGLKGEILSLKLQNENEILPRLQNIEDCYLATYKRYADSAEKIEGMQEDIELLKKVVAEHSEKLQRIS